jgi:hypothetical protein
MFRFLADARQQLAPLTDPDMLTTPVTDAEIERILAHLAPQLWIAPGEGAAERLGGTRLGGAPDLPTGMDWPLRPIPADATARGQQLRDHHAWILRHIERELPYEFLAQIDLAEAGCAAAKLGLPASGRLLFFWDGVGGLMFSEPAFARVIWDDDRPPWQLARATIPPVMDELERAYDPSGQYKKPYVYPSRSMRLQPILHLPFADAAEMLGDPALETRRSDLEFCAFYHELLRGEGAMLKRGDAGQRRQRLMGTPEPEQDDPRLGLEASEGGDWQLLLQLDLADLAQNRLVEGTVYFLIRRDDLALRDFSDVRAIYQQT